MKAFLILEDGTLFKGIRIGSSREVISELVFNTSMTGYLGVLTAPASAGQAVVMTYPLIGNYGVCHEDMESAKPWPDGLIVRELSRIPSNFRSEDTIQNFLELHDIPGISGIDTRALTQILRKKGSMNGMITTREYPDFAEPISRIKAYRPAGLVKTVSCRESYVMAPAVDTEQPVKRVALLDVGVSRSICRMLCGFGCEVTVYPCDTAAETILAENFDGILISDGPGDPKENGGLLREVRKLYETDMPIFAVGLGHQVLALAAGADTFKLTCGHRGSNQPVKDMESGQVYITVQNHGYAVDPDSVDPRTAVPLFVNVNDHTNEGLKYTGKNIVSIQFYPDICTGAVDSGLLYKRFFEMFGKNTNDNSVRVIWGGK